MNFTFIRPTGEISITTAYDARILVGDVIKLDEQDYIAAAVIHRPQSKDCVVELRPRERQNAEAGEPKNDKKRRPAKKKSRTKVPTMQT
tara:strand:- start:8252 stop:8518 length:267 start_codon:yes stop_codon:yes gene_type:complete